LWIDFSRKETQTTQKDSFELEILLRHQSFLQQSKTLSIR